MAKTYISDIFTQQTAYPQDYPFGNGRCVRRVWFDQATKGAAKGQFRQSAQTTTKAFNALYNAKIDELGSREAALKWSVDEFQVQLKSHCWNAPKQSTYHDVVAPYLNTENDHIEFDSLCVYSTAKKMVEFRTAWIDTGILLPEHIKIYESLERFNRRHNPRCWAELEAKSALPQETANAV